MMILESELEDLALKEGFRPHSLGWPFLPTQEAESKCIPPLPQKRKLC